MDSKFEKAICPKCDKQTTGESGKAIICPKCGKKYFLTVGDLILHKTMDEFIKKNPDLVKILTG
jgi:hypothetical protein